MLINDPEQLGLLFAERVNAGDLEGLVALYEQGATFVGPDGAGVSGVDAIRGRLEDLLATAPHITPAGNRAIMAGDIALMSNCWQMSLRARDGELTGHGTSTEVARRQPCGGWLYVIDHPVLVDASPTAPVGTTNGA